ncbi:nitrile hydratase accessory protein [Ideonella azotifigens]|uniref:Nitrile hydratase beta subunit-like N-terminal domain-containing protein n=1 Tax=Ideonella azotifigens TaxID=513160 RepID=A0ABN1K6Z2_9BURK|nr:nitrile hydratase accessory protein [Ideonella azotifigens]MCD2342195.1 nitrile hydratase accessory protein [Ideonella azotifigens]
MNTGIDSGLDVTASRLDGEGPAFDKPWQAEAFGLVVKLHQAGLFPWADWVRIFSEEIKAAPALPGESVNDAYYRQWVPAMERLVASLGLAAEDDIARRASEWRLAYLHTPHGQPVSLVNASCPPAHAHEHTPRRVPVAVSLACAG